MDNYYGSLLRKSSHQNIAIAEWKLDTFGQPHLRLPDPHYPSEHKRPVQIKYFAQVVYSINKTIEELDENVLIVVSIVD